MKRKIYEYSVNFEIKKENKVYERRIYIVQGGFHRFLNDIAVILELTLIPLFFYFNHKYINSVLFDILIFIFGLCLFFVLSKTKRQILTKDDFLTKINELIKNVEND